MIVVLEQKALRIDMSVYSAPLFVIKISGSQVLIPFMTISHVLLLIPY